MHSVCMHVTYYDLRVLSISVIGFPKRRRLDGGWMGGVNCIQFIFFGSFLIFKTPTVR